MLKKRLIPMMLLSDGRLIKTVNFAGSRDVGDPVQAAKVYSDQSADELVVLNVSRTNRTIGPIMDILSSLSRNCFMPIAAGGGIKVSKMSGSHSLRGRQSSSKFCCI